MCNVYADLDAAQADGFSIEQAHKTKAALTKGVEMALSTSAGANKVVSYGSCGIGKSSWYIVGRHECYVCESTDVANMIVMLAICLS